MEARFRVTLGHETVGTLEISEPGGWDEAKLHLVRNKDFHGMDQIYDQPLTFYGDGLQNNGGIQFIRDIEAMDGPDSQITTLFEISMDEGYTWEPLYSGLLSLDTLKEIDFYKADIGMVRDDFWTKFINRKGTPVDLMGTVDLDGQARVPVTNISIPLPDQKLNLKFRSEMYGEDDDLPLDPIVYFDFDRSGGNEVRVGTIELPVVKIDTLPTRYAMTNEAANPIDIYTPAYEFFSAKWRGVYTIDIQLVLSTSPYIIPFPNGDQTLSTACWIRKNDQSPIVVTRTDLGVNGFDGRTKYTYQATWNLDVGDRITLYFYYSGASAVTNYIVFNGIFEDSYIQIDGATEYYLDVPAQGVLLKDAAESILSKIIGADYVVHSDFLDGCKGLYSLHLGLHIRGKLLSEKPISMSFDDWWEGANPLFNLGLSYEKTGSPETSKIRIEQKEYFYNKTATSINLDWVNNIERSYDLNSIFKLIEMGYEKWTAESDGGLDDFQTKKTYATRFKTIGKEIRMLSKFIAASLAIEQARRNRIKEGEDHQLDEEIIIIALSEAASPISPELAENFTTVTGILNPESRYNLRLSVARNFERWKNYYNGCLQWYLASPSTEYVFTKGEGNVALESVLWESDCEGGGSSPEPAVAENTNIPATGDFLFMPVKYTFSHPLTWEQWKAIRDNSTLAIGVSRTDADHRKCFIESLEFEVTNGKASFVVWLGENNPIL